MSICLKTFLCPICHDLLLDPVLANDGFVYNKGCIVKVFEGKLNALSPMTRNPLTNTFLPVRWIKTLIIDLINGSMVNSSYFNTNGSVLQLSDISTNDQIERFYIFDQWIKDLSEYQINNFSLDIMESLVSNPLLSEENKKIMKIRLFVENMKTNIGSEQKMMDFVQKYLTENEDINIIVNDTMDNYLTLCCKKKMIGPALLLLKTNINYNYTNIDDENALIISCKLGLSAIVIELLKKPELNYNYIDIKNENSLLLSCKHGFSDIGLELLNKPDINYNFRDNNGFSALLHACHNKLEKVALKLLDKPDIDYNNTSSCGYNAFLLACNSKVENVALKLLTMPEIDYNCIYMSSDNPLLVACVNELSEIALKLLEKPNIDYNFLNNHGDNALTLTCDKPGMEKVVMCLLNKQDIMYDNINDKGDSPLIQACYGKNEKIIMKLLDIVDIDYTISNDNDQTPLRICLREGLEDCVIKLIDLPKIFENNAPLTILATSCRKKLNKVALYLLEDKNIDVSCSNKEIKNTISYAIENNMYLVARIMIDRCENSWTQSKKQKL